MPLATTALALLNAFRANRDQVHSLLLNTLIRHAPGPIYVSVAAHAEAQSRTTRDLREVQWKEQSRVLGDKDRKVFAWDHFYPVSVLRRQLDALETPTVQEVKTILDRASVAWILRSEDNRLNDLGFRHLRPDPLAAYAEAGIRLLYGPE